MPTAVAETVIIAPAKQQNRMPMFGNNILRFYEQHFQFIILDNRGVGVSDQPKGPYNTKMMAADTPYRFGSSL